MHAACGGGGYLHEVAQRLPMLALVVPHVDEDVVERLELRPVGDRKRLRVGLLDRAELVKEAGVLLLVVLARDGGDDGGARDDGAVVVEEGKGCDVDDWLGFGRFTVLHGNPFQERV